MPKNKQIAPIMKLVLNWFHFDHDVYEFHIFHLQVEKDELQAALEEAESALEQEENRVLRAQMEVVQARQVQQLYSYMWSHIRFLNFNLHLRTLKVGNLNF